MEAQARSQIRIDASLTVIVTFAGRQFEANGSEMGRIADYRCIFKSSDSSKSDQLNSFAISIPLVP